MELRSYHLHKCTVGNSYSSFLVPNRGQSDGQRRSDRYNSFHSEAATSDLLRLCIERIYIAYSKHKNKTFYRYRSNHRLQDREQVTPFYIEDQWTRDSEDAVFPPVSGKSARGPARRWFLPAGEIQGRMGGRTNQTQSFEFGRPEKTWLSSLVFKFEFQNNLTIVNWECNNLTSKEN